MDPPEAYSPPGLDQVPVSEMHPLLQRLCREHSALSEAMNVVEEALVSIPGTGFSAQMEAALLGFCQVVESDFIPHSRHEEVILFPLLHERLILDGEHSNGRVATTAVDVMKDEHLTVIKLSAVIENFLKIASHLPDEGSALIMRDSAVKHAGSLVALLRLHIFREDKIVFCSAHRLISAQEFDAMRSE